MRATREENRPEKVIARKPSNGAGFRVQWARGTASAEQPEKIVSSFAPRRMVTLSRPGRLDLQLAGTLGGRVHDPLGGEEPRHGAAVRIIEKSVVRTYILNPQALRDQEKMCVGERHHESCAQLRDPSQIGRVGMWRGGCRFGISVGRLFRLAVPYCPYRDSVSTPRSSNRTCRSPASGSRTKPHAFTHGWSLPRAVKRTSPKCP